MALSRFIAVLALVSTGLATDDHFAPRGTGASASFRRKLVLLDGPSDKDPAAVLKGSQLRTGVGRLGQPIKELDLKLLVLPIHDQSVPSATVQDDKRTKVVCPASSCPSISPCPAIHSARGDSSIGTCWNADLEDQPSGAQRKVVKIFHPWNIHFSGLDICIENVTGAPGDLVRPNCPWAGDKWRGSEAQPAGVERLKDGWAGQVFVLEDVFLDAFGRVFNSTHRFDAGGCPVPHQLAYSKDTKVVEIEEAVNLLAATPESPPGSKDTKKTSVFHTMVYELPLLLPVMRMLPQLHNAVLATTNAKFHRTVSAHLTSSLPWEAMLQSISAPAPGTLWMVRRLVQPVFQPCQQASPALWREMRQSHLLPRQVVDAAERLRREAPLVPPRAPAIPKNWMVVVHEKAMGTPVKGTSVTALLEQYFPRNRIAVFRNGFSIKDWELFNKAALFITVQHAAMANVMFMPPNSIVLQLRPPGNLGATDEESDLGVSLAEASEVRSYTAFCQLAADAQGSLQCDRYPIMDVIDRVSHHVFTAFEPQRLRRPKWPGLLKKGQESWFAKSAAAVRDVEQWAKCVSNRGSWRYNPKPRILPWEYTGSTNLCDNRHSLKGGLTARKSDEFVTAGGLSKDWNVRESLKYDWVVPKGKCPSNQLAPQKESFAEFSGPEFCSRVGKGRTFLFLGDSLTDQFTAVFLNNMLKHIPKPATWAISEEIPQECIDWLPPDGMVPHLFCRDIRFHSDVCPGLRVIYVRSDYLLLGNRRVFDTMGFSRFSFLKDVDVAVVNRGAHYEPTEKFTRDLTAFFRYFRNRFPEMLMVYRNSPPGHDSCENAEVPLKARQNPKELPYNWGEFRDQNEVARQLVRKHDYVYMDIDTMTALRPDGHKGLREYDNTTDCLHYCTPGPLDVWPQHFFNTMLWADPLGVSSGVAK